MKVEAYKKVMVIGADKMSTIIDYTDRNTCLLFGDAASAVLLEPTSMINPLDSRIQFLHLMEPERILYMKGGGSLNPPTHETVDKGLSHIYQDGKAVFKEAVKGMADVSVEIMEKNNLKSEDIAYLSSSSGKFKNY